VAVALAAMVAGGMAAGPGHDALADEPCNLPRRGLHHSLGLDTWNEEYPRPDRDLNAVMLFVSFPDAVPRATPREIAADYFPATSDFFLRASYGGFRLAVEIAEDWVQLPRPSHGYGIRRDWDPEPRSAYLRDALAALAPGVDLGGYDVVYLVADPDAPGVDSDATKVVNFDRPMEVGGSEIRRLVTVFESRPPDRNVLAHETGHVFDLPDLYHRPETGRGDWDTYVGDWDVMGSQFGLAPEPFGWHKWKLGWLGSEHVACVRGENPARHALQPLGAPLDGAGPEGDTRLVVVRTGADEALVLEARTPVGNDATACSQGVLLYRVYGDVASADGPVRVLDGHPGTGTCHGRSVQPELADAPLGTGESYWLAEENIRVEVGDRTAAGGWHVKVVRE
jgi:M6 family metalloprotease-like protein